MTKEKKNDMLHCLEEHRPGKWKIRTKLFVVILIMLAVSILLFWGLWNLQESVCHVFENLHLISWFDEDTYIEQIKEDAVNYNVPELESDKTAQKAFRPFLKKHTGCYIYGHDDELFRAGHAAKVTEKIMYGSIISDSMDILGEYTNIVPVQFANGTYDVVYSSFMRTRFVYPYVIASALFSIFIFFLGVLSYMGSVIKRMDGLKDAVVNMSQGDLTHAIPQCGEDEVGIVRGLAWTSVGGDTLQIEVNVMPGDGKLQMTGQMGDVMKESAQIALTYVRSVADRYGVESKYFKEHDLHLHIPEGAVPKDGDCDALRSDRQKGPRQRCNDRRDHSAGACTADRRLKGKDTCGENGTYEEGARAGQEPAGYGGDLEGDHEGYGDSVREDHGRRGARSVRVIQESCTSQIEGE